MMISLALVCLFHGFNIVFGIREHVGTTHEDLKQIISDSYEQCFLDDSCYNNAREIGSSNVQSGNQNNNNNNNDNSVHHRSGSSSIIDGYPCVNGYSANLYPCSNIDMLSHLDLTDLGITRGIYGNDIWGWTDDTTGNEYALAGLTDGTSFVNITDPYNPFVIAVIDSFELDKEPYWRDIKVYKNFAYIVCDSTDEHGLQYVNLTKLIIDAMDYYDRYGIYIDNNTNNNTRNFYHLTVNNSDNHQNRDVKNCHNLFINEDTGYIYTVGCNTASGGLTIFKIVLNNETNIYEPILEALFADDGYTHDLQCVMFHGDSLSDIISNNYNDSSNSNSEEIPSEIELCAAYNEDTITLIDVTYKNDIKIVKRMRTSYYNFMINNTIDNYQLYNYSLYSHVSYTHQGWFDNTHNFIFMDDELDEWYVQNYVSNNIYKNNTFTRTYVINITDIYNAYLINNKPRVSNYHAIDHNHYVYNNYLYQAHYRAGVRILNVSKVDDPNLPEIGYFDTWPSDDDADFNGVWSVYPFFDSDIIIAQDIEKGLFILKLNLNESDSNTESSSSSSSTTAEATEAAMTTTSMATTEGGEEGNSDNEIDTPSSNPTNIPTNGPTDDDNDDNDSGDNSGAVSFWKNDFAVGLKLGTAIVIYSCFCHFACA